MAEKAPMSALPTRTSAAVGGNTLFWAIFAIGLALRVYLALQGHAIRHPDEIFQTVEQAHRIVFGYGVDVWEFDRHIRWLGLPLLLTLPQYLAAALQQGPQFYMAVTRIGLVCLSILPVPLLYRALQSRFGATLAALGCLFPLFWYESLDFASSPLPDAVSAPLLCCTALLPLAWARRDIGWCVAFAGLAALTCAVRFQLAPAVLLIAIPVVWQASARSRWLLLSAAVGWLAVIAAFDVATGLYPFEDIVENLRANALEGIADKFGTAPWYYYAVSIAVQSGWALPVLVALLALTIREHWRLTLPAVVLLLVLSLIAHKEPRFYFPATMLLTLSAGWAIAAIAQRLTRDRRAAMAVASVIPLAIAALTGPLYAAALTQREDNLALAEMAAAAHPDLCGLAITAGGNLFETAGYTYLHRNVPLEHFAPAAFGADKWPGYNVLLAPTETLRGDVAATYVPQSCFSGPSSAPVCLFVRTGGCS